MIYIHSSQPVSKIESAFEHNPCFQDYIYHIIVAIIDNGLGSIKSMLFSFGKVYLEKHEQMAFIKTHKAALYFDG